ncbi:MAG: hypothetical protein HC896_13940 [Bacteroidales bacterium]|nr:hypothetical protein [Bacteroidales bacterium]
MFIKPELIWASDKLKHKDILALIFNKIDEFGLGIKQVKVLSAQYLAEHNIIAQHYGVINLISNSAVSEMTQEAKKKFWETYNLDIENAQVLGSLEFLKRYPMFSATSLDYLWQNSGYEKLAGGTYCAKLNIDGDYVYLVNGFHPRQLEHFTLEGEPLLP